MLKVADDLQVPVSFVGMSPQISIAAQVANDVYGKYGFDAIVLSIVDGEHVAGSLHYIGHAIDFRIRTVANQEIRQAIRDEIKLALGREWDVILSDNIHIEWQPKRGVNLG